MSINTSVELKTIAQISGMNVKFYIDAFQRGYRWTPSEVRDLLDDIHDFSQSDYKSHTADAKDKFYCLQPIIITKSKTDGSWKVIDGQQRMTTIYLIYLYYNNVASKTKKRSLPYEIHYNGKTTLENCLSDIQSEEIYEEEGLQILKDKYGNDDIDCFFVLEAYGEVCRYFSVLDSDMETESHVEEMRGVFNAFLQIIWYELIDCDEQDEISMFTKINMGKIPLTNAELIKALILKSDEANNSAQLDYIANEWNTIESQLADEGFWSFLVNQSGTYSTRIDFIFEIMARRINDSIFKLLLNQEEGKKESLYVEHDSNKQYFSFYVFNNYVKYLTGNECNESEAISLIWNEIEEYYGMFRDWYQRRKWYHMIGYIVETAGANYIEKITDLCVLYKLQPSKDSQAGHKTLFEENLRRLIIETIIGNKKSSKQDISDFISGLKYGNDNLAIKKILLLFNICSLEIFENKTDARFPFDKYKDRTISWDIEHINATADERPNDTYDRADGLNACLVWLKNTKKAPFISEILMPDGVTKVEDAIDLVIEKALYLPQNEPGTVTFNNIYDSVISYFNESGDIDNDSIANLTLLDSGINRSYKNDIFPLKRKTILDNCAKDVFMPLCTKEVFLKAYEESDELLKWTKTDMEGYLKAINERIAMYLKLED